MKSKCNMLNRKWPLVMICVFCINTSYANFLGEQPGGDVGTGGDTGQGGGGVIDGSRGGGKGGTGDQPPSSNNRNGSDGNNNNSGNNKPPPPPPPDPPIMRIFQEIPINPNFPAEGIWNADRMEGGKVLQHVEIKTDNELAEAVHNEQSNIMSGDKDPPPPIESNNESNNGPHKPLNGQNDGLQGETKDLQNLAQNAKNQAKSNEAKSKFDQLLKFIEKYNDYQKKYSNKIGDRSNGFNQEDNPQAQNAEDNSENNQEPADLDESGSSSNSGQNASTTLANISQAIFNLMTGGGSFNSVGNSLMNFIKGMFDQNPMSGAPYVNEALRSAFADGRPKIQNPIDPVREKLMTVARSYVAPGVKIQYSQDKDKRNGPNSFDCSGFVAYVYAKLGLSMAKANGGAPTVSQIIDKNGPFHEVVNTDDAKVGDLIVHLGEKDNHVGIYSGKDDQGNIKEISATTRNGFAKYDPDAQGFKSSIKEHPPKQIGESWRIYQWNK